MPPMQRFNHAPSHSSARKVASCWILKIIWPAGERGAPCVVVGRGRGHVGRLVGVLAVRGRVVVAAVGVLQPAGGRRLQAVDVCVGCEREEHHVAARPHKCFCKVYACCACGTPCWRACLTRAIDDRRGNMTVAGLRCSKGCALVACRKGTCLCSIGGGAGVGAPVHRVQVRVSRYDDGVLGLCWLPVACRARMLISGKGYTWATYPVHPGIIGHFLFILDLLNIPACFAT